ncbi:hypothetical protein Q31b_13460 [Novipirellula aureliae]|uniref:Uncharacterized protein n=1 Tax=Novipirellula aureliae TaxID=2527966 RepID=A0A5C6E5L2_9BACT|nr:hypothetical protein [Novipirellula aureliae]TWU43814.1 hypothetical protein Q31b_13460 [Novipirellula aureliae]
MAKFYVQSGNLRTIVQAESSRKAAIWAVHQAMQQVFPIDDQPATNPTNHQADSPLTVIMLTKKLKVSERGFDRSDAGELSTLEVMNEWNQMVSTLDRLERMMHGWDSCTVGNDQTR